MARWTPKTLKEKLEDQVVRIDQRIKDKEQEIKQLKEERQQADAALKAAGGGKT
jgi:hypothetical protein